MVDTFLELVVAMSRIGTVTEFFANTDLITIEGVEKGGKPFRLSYRCVEGEENAPADS